MTLDALIAVMKPGLDYSPYIIGKMLHLTRYKASGLLRKATAAGLVECHTGTCGDLYTLNSAVRPDSASRSRPSVYERGELQPVHTRWAEFRKSCEATRR